MGRRLVQLPNVILRHLAVPSFAILLGIGSAIAQSGDLRAQDGKPAAAPADASKDTAAQNQRRTDEFAEAAQAINGPAGNPECVWIGRRVVVLVWRDDLDTAFRHLDLYDRFGCPGGHIQATFRCLTRFATQIDNKVPDSLTSRVHACWINPAAQPQTTAAQAPAPGAAAPAPAAPAAAAAPAQPPSK
ncbi:MAG: beta-1-3, beta-1-6-glucan biosynthesis protein [Bradyrhizobium sp.]|uniref:beta-1-3, beta-1-6-glucan biosynthesis protein n=1 Tax=Bradyrhizobium sp. TaxID=376 RepID=UPI0025BEC1D2|nr:beta-1-3, beta-1-6-glucan biosynthesis protein [Bradyrhizobium sp.]MBI5264985.1 beta-1-3, beta-1-6-glucan biosynthesis protein [Bradyrhizobium sp.]